METLFIGKNCICLDKIDSTNSYLTHLAQKRDLPDGTLVVANLQEQGRGQRGSQWYSEFGKNLIISILLRPYFLKADEQFLLNEAVALGLFDFVKQALSSFSQERRGDVRIKWPNDIYIGNKKIAGILIENSMSGKKLQHSVIGMGVNVNQENFPAELPNPTSLKLISGKEFDLKACLSQLCSFIEKWYLQLRSGHYDQIDAAYIKNFYRLGEWSNYQCKGEILKAKIIGVTKVGKLMLETETEKRIEYDFKEVKFC